MSQRGSRHESPRKLRRRTMEVKASHHGSRDVHSIPQESESATRYHRAFIGPNRAQHRLDRLTEITVNRIRSGHCPLLMGYQKRIGASASDACPSCGACPESVEHYLQDCPAHDKSRLDIFGISTIEEKLRDTKGLAEFLKRTGRLSPRH